MYIIFYRSYSQNATVENSAQPQLDKEGHSPYHLSGLGMPRKSYMSEKIFCMYMQEPGKGKEDWAILCSHKLDDDYGKK